MSPPPQAPKPKTYHCLDLWAMPLDVLNLVSHDERTSKRASFTRTSNGPFAPDSLHHEATMSSWDQILTIILLFIPMGGPIVCVFVTLASLVLGNWQVRLLVLAIVFFLMYHPLPTSYDSRTNKLNTSVINSKAVHLLYRYFTYRLVWTDDNDERIRNKVWVGAGPPHGVLPFANLLSIPACNLFLDRPFVGAPASVVFHTPFLRYFTLLPSTPVSSKSIAAATRAGACVGLVPDGIAGIFQQSDRQEVVALKTRKGLARHALKHGTDLLPAYSFGNTQAFSAWWDPWGCLEYISRKAQASMFLYWGLFGLPIPKRVQITMVFGRIIHVEKVENPTDVQISELHNEFLSRIQECFELHKGALGWGHKKLVFV